MYTPTTQKREKLYPMDESQKQYTKRSSNTGKIKWYVDWGYKNIVNCEENQDNDKHQVQDSSYFWVRRERTHERTGSLFYLRQGVGNMGSFDYSSCSITQTLSYSLLMNAIFQIL